MDDGRWTMDDGRWKMEDGRWTTDVDDATVDDRRWMMDDGTDENYPSNKRFRKRQTDAVARAEIELLGRGRKDRWEGNVGHKAE
jgi:hypothetical protein